MDGWTTWSTRALPTLMILWSSDSYPVTILKHLLSFNFIAPELKAQRSLKPLISKLFSNPLLNLIPTDLVLLLLLSFKIRGGKKIINPCFIYRIPIVLNRLFLHEDLLVEFTIFFHCKTYLKRGFHTHYMYPSPKFSHLGLLYQSKGVLDSAWVFIFCLNAISNIVSNPIRWQREDYNV